MYMCIHAVWKRTNNQIKIKSRLYMFNYKIHHVPELNDLLYMSNFKIPHVPELNDLLYMSY